MPKVKGQNYPTNLYLTRGRDGKFHWYDRDPKTLENRTNSEIASLEANIMGLVGNGDDMNPVIVQLVCAHIIRSEAFNISQPAEVRRGGNVKHFEDLDGAVVDVLEFRNSNPAFPFSGVVFDDRGDVVGNRKYAPDGKCEDGVDGHTIVLIAGPAVFESDVPNDEPGDEPSPEE